MSLARSTLIGGPAKIQFNPLAAGTSPTFFSKDDIKWDPKISTVPVISSMHGEIDESVVDEIIEVVFTPVGAWENLGVLFPTAYLNPTIGNRIFGDTDTPCLITSNNGDLYTMIAAAVTKMPTIFLGVSKTIFGPVTITGLRGSNLDTAAASSIATIQTSQAYADATFDPSKIYQQKYSAAWGAITGFTSFQAQEGWEISFEVKLEPVPADSVGTADMKIAAFRAMAKCKPIGPTGAQILTNLRIQDTGNPLGRRLGANAADLTITGSNVTVVLKNAAMKQAGFVFGGKALRNGEVGWVTTTGFTAGVPAALATVA